MHLIRKYATRGVTQITYDPKRKGGQLVLTRTLEYFGFELERETEPLEDFSPENAERAGARWQRDWRAVKYVTRREEKPCIDRGDSGYLPAIGGTTPRWGSATLHHGTSGSSSSSLDGRIQKRALSVATRGIRSSRRNRALRDASIDGGDQGSGDRHRLRR
jgi:hypothetical protein